MNFFRVPCKERYRRLNFRRISSPWVYSFLQEAEEGVARSVGPRGPGSCGPVKPVSVLAAV